MNKFEYIESYDEVIEKKIQKKLKDDEEFYSAQERWAQKYQYKGSKAQRKVIKALKEHGKTIKLEASIQRKFDQSLCF